MIHSTRFKIDMHLIYYPSGSEIPPHKDPVLFGQRHYRLNLELKEAQAGGEFQCETCILRWGRLRFFRPDLYQHAVTKIDQGSRLIFSIGWLRKPAQPSPKE